MAGTKLGLAIYCLSSCSSFKWLGFPLETNVLLQAHKWDACGHNQCQHDEDTKNEASFAIL